MVNVIAGSLVLLLLAYWFYVHILFKAALKEHEPELYQNNADYSQTRFTVGFAFIDIALSGQYRKSKSADVKRSGKRLVRAYEVKSKLVGIGLLATPALIALWLLFNISTTD